MEESSVEVAVVHRTDEAQLGQNTYLKLHPCIYLTL